MWQWRVYASVTSIVVDPHVRFIRFRWLSLAALEPGRSALCELRKAVRFERAEGPFDSITFGNPAT